MAAFSNRISFRSLMAVTVGDDRFLALLRNYGDFAIAALNVKDAVTGVALGENDLAFAVFCEALSLTYRFEKGLKLERHPTLHWLPAYYTCLRGKIPGRS
jgi:hypothetical protein